MVAEPMTLNCGTDEGVRAMGIMATESMPRYVGSERKPVDGSPTPL